MSPAIAAQEVKNCLLSLVLGSSISGKVPRVWVGESSGLEYMHLILVLPLKTLAKWRTVRYIRLVMSKLHHNAEEIKRLHPRFLELKAFHGIEDERTSAGAVGPQKMASGLLSIALKCVGASLGEKLPLTKKLPATTTVGKLKILCESFFKLKSIKPKLFLQEEGSPFPTLLDDDMASLIDVGISNNSTILVDEEYQK